MFYAISYVFVSIKIITKHFWCTQLFILIDPTFSDFLSIPVTRFFLTKNKKTFHKSYINSLKSV